MGWFAITVVLLCLGSAALWARYNPDRGHTRPPTYRADRRHRRLGVPVGATHSPAHDLARHPDGARRVHVRIRRRVRELMGP